jgi:hypothetical protein
MRCGFTVSAVFTLGALLAGPPDSAAQGVTVALTPNGQQVAPGATFTLDITVTQAGSAFNGLDAVIGYDPAALTYISVSPISLQEGALMTGACGNTFHVFRSGASTDTLTDVLLCNGVSLTGPGQVYRLQFRASTTPQITQVRFLPGLQFYEAGLYVNPVHSIDAAVGIGMAVPVDVGPSPASDRLHMRITPNPARGGAVFTLEADRPGRQNVSVFDVRGRVVRTFDDSVTTAGVRTVVWDGRDSAGHAVPAGIYLVKFEVAGRSVSNRVSLIR